MSRAGAIDHEIGSQAEVLRTGPLVHLDARHRRIGAAPRVRRRVARGVRGRAPNGERELPLAFVRRRTVTILSNIVRVSRETAAPSQQSTGVWRRLSFVRRTARLCPRVLRSLFGPIAHEVADVSQRKATKSSLKTSTFRGCPSSKFLRQRAGQMEGGSGSFG